jgi:antitoxin component YwqK of YwqJK toxin-antitoxin module
MNMGKFKTYKDGVLCKCDFINQEFFPSGKIASETPYVKGEKHGIEKTYRENGALQRKTPYTNGLICGIERTFFSFGQQIESETPFVKGIRHGIARTFYRKGSLKESLPYVQGLKHGIGIAYFSAGKKSAETAYKEGLKNGISKTFYDTGRIESLASFENDVPVSPYFEFFYDRHKYRLKKRIYKKRTDSTGMVKCYDEDGLLLREYLQHIDLSNGISAENYV